MYICTALKNPSVGAFLMYFLIHVGVLLCVRLWLLKTGLPEETSWRVRCGPKKLLMTLLRS